MLFRELFFNDVLRGDAAVVRARHPIGFLPKHAVGADQGVLQRVIEGVPHMQGPRNIRRRNDDDKRFFVFIYFGGKEFGVLPFFYEFAFYFLRFIRFGQHGVLPSVLNLRDVTSRVTYIHFTNLQPVCA